MARVTVVVMTDDPGAKGCNVAKVSLSCDMCEFKTAVLKRRKAGDI